MTAKYKNRSELTEMLHELVFIENNSKFIHSAFHQHLQSASLLTKD